MIVFAVVLWIVASGANVHRDGGREHDHCQLLDLERRVNAGNACRRLGTIGRRRVRTHSDPSSALRDLQIEQKDLGL